MLARPRCSSAFVLAVLVALASCVASPRVEPAGRVAHTVYFWLRGDAPAGTADAMIAFYRREVPKAVGVVSVVVGVARESERDVVDDGFSVGATTVFRSGVDEVAWQTDPIHDRLRARFLPFVERVVVYDTAVIDATRPR